VLVQTAKISKTSSIPKINESPTTPLIKISAYPTDCLIEPFACADLIFGFAIPVQISQQLTLSLLTFSKSQKGFGCLLKSQY